MRKPDSTAVRAILKDDLAEYGLAEPENLGAQSAWDRPVHRCRDPKAHKRAGPVNETGQTVNKKTKPTPFKYLQCRAFNLLCKLQAPPRAGSLPLSHRLFGFSTRCSLNVYISPSATTILQHSNQLGGTRSVRMHTTTSVIVVDRAPLDYNATVLKTAQV